LEEVERRALDDAGQPVVELPLIAGGIDLGGLYELAAVLSAAAAGEAVA
jgi:hypothetical protein